MGWGLKLAAGQDLTAGAGFAARSRAVSIRWRASSQAKV